MIAVSDFANNRVKIMDKRGALIRCFPYQSPTGIAIIPSLSLLAVSSYSKHVIDIFDISLLLPNKLKFKEEEVEEGKKWRWRDLLPFNLL